MSAYKDSYEDPALSHGSFSNNPQTLVKGDCMAAIVNPHAQDVKLIQTLMPGRERIYAAAGKLTYNGLSQFGPFEFCILEGWIDEKTSVSGLVLFGTFTVELSAPPVWWKCRGNELL